MTWAVWRALFLREAMQVLTAKEGEYGWIWIVVNPLLLIIFLILMFTFIRMRIIEGMETEVWIMTGVLFYYLFQLPANQASNAINANKQLIAYRQVKVVDTILVKGFLSIYLQLLVAIVILLGSWVLFQFDIFPDTLLTIIEAAALMALLGVGYAMVHAVCKIMSPFVAKILDFMHRPLFITSGVIFPLERFQNIPEVFEYLTYNPLMHGVAAVRHGFADPYLPFEPIEIDYLAKWAVGSFFFGLLLIRRYEQQILMR